MGLSARLLSTLECLLDSLNEDRRSPFQQCFHGLSTHFCESIFNVVNSLAGCWVCFSSCSEPSHQFSFCGVTTLRLWCGSFTSADPDLPVMNGILEVCHGSEPPFLRILPAAFTCSFPRSGGYSPFYPESLPFLFSLPWKRILKDVGSGAFASGRCFGKWRLLELLSPYLRLFSFCDYTIPHPKETVYSQMQQAWKEIFVHI